VPASGSGQPSIYVNGEVNIGIAIGLATNLVVPVIRRADKLSSQRHCARGRRAYRKGAQGKARRRRPRRRHVHGQQQRGEWSWASAPIINGGQAGIVTMEAVVKKGRRARRRLARNPAYDELVPVARPSASSTVTLPAVFLADLKQRLERMGPQGDL